MELKITQADLIDALQFWLQEKHPTLLTGRHLYSVAKSGYGETYELTLADGDAPVANVED